MMEIKWTDSEIVGAVVAAIIGLIGVLLTIYFSRNNNSSDGKIHQQNQRSFFSWKNKQYQAGRDISLKDDIGKKKS